MQTFLPRWRTLCKYETEIETGTETETETMGDLLHIFAKWQQRFACQFANRGATNAPNCDCNWQLQLKLFMHFVQASATNLIVVI